VQEGRSTHFSSHRTAFDDLRPRPTLRGRYARAHAWHFCSLLFLLSVLGPLSTYGQTTGPVGHWTFDSASVVGTQILDQSGNNLNGTLSGGVVSTTGVINQGLSFDGRSGFIEFSYDSLTDLSGNLTLALWVKTQNKSRTEALISRYNAAGAETGYLLRTDPGGHVELVVGGNNTTGGHGVALTDTSAIVNDGQWHHIAAVITFGQGVSFFVDGGLSSTQALNLVAQPSGSSLQVGLNPWTDYGTYFTGSLDDVRIYNRVLSAVEIAALFASSQASTVSAPAITPPGGAFTDSVSVSLASSTRNSSIYFTTDGSNPTTKSTKYSSPFKLTSSVMVKAQASASGMNDSAVASAAFTISSSQPVPPPPVGGPAGDWTFDAANVTGSQVLDSSGHNLTGTLVGDMAFGTGVINQGLSFSGINGYVQFSPDAITELTNDLSLALWVNTSNKTRSEALISRYAAGGVEHGYLLRTEPSGHVQLIVGGTNNGASGRAVALTDSGKPINDGKWHHVAVVITLGQGVSFFVDGALSSTQALNIVQGTSGSPLQFGLNPWIDYGTYFTGSLDELRIYQRALQSSEIAALANVSAPPAPTPSLGVSPLNLSFKATAGSSNPAAQPVSVSNSGGGTLSWTAGASQPWITLSAASGTGAKAISVGTAINGLVAGTYSGTVTITAAGAAPSTRTVTVNLAISAATSSPTLSVNPSSLSFSGTSGSSNPAAQSVTVSHTGSGNWTAAANQSWITLSTTATTISAGANIAGLSAGTYNGVVTVSAPGVTSQPVNVSLVVSPASAPPPPPPTGSQHYVAPNGSSSGDGSIGNPWDLATALAGPSAVKPGDTIWLRGGLYGGANGTPGTLYTANIAGTASQPVLVRQYPGERATVNGNIAVYGAYVYYWGFEITSLNPDRSDTATRYECMDTYPGSTGVKIINMVLHDCLQGVGFWVDAIDSEATGNLIYYNGEEGATRGQGHGIYAQNDTGKKLLQDNIVFGSFDINMQFYGSGAAFVRNFNLNGNVSFNAGTPVANYVDNVLFAVGSGLDNIVVNNTYTYQDPSLDLGYSRLGWQFGGVNGSLTETGNYWIGGNRALELWGWTNLSAANNTYYTDQGDEIIMDTVGEPTTGYSFTNNTYYGSGLFNFNGSLVGFGDWQTASGLDKSSKFTTGRPTGVWTFVRPNAYEVGRANIIIYNWDLKSTVGVDVSGVLKAGDTYVVRDAENFYGAAVVSGTYTGGVINVPMTGLTAAPTVGSFPVAPQHTAPEFGVFVLLKQ
jgi:hypothetical protein